MVRQAGGKSRDGLNEAEVRHLIRNAASSFSEEGTRGGAIPFINAHARFLHQLASEPKESSGIRDDGTSVRTPAVTKGGTGCQKASTGLDISSADPTHNPFGKQQHLTYCFSPPIS